jgi:hypothetical protein
MQKRPSFAWPSISRRDSPYPAKETSEKPVGKAENGEKPEFTNSK